MNSNTDNTNENENVNIPHGGFDFEDVLNNRANAMARDHIFHAMFSRMAMTYDRTFPPAARRILEFFLLIAALMALFILIYIHVAFVKSPITCLDHINLESLASQHSRRSDSKNSVIRVEILTNPPTNYTLIQSYEKEYERVIPEQSGLDKHDLLTLRLPVTKSTFTDLIQYRCSLSNQPYYEHLIVLSNNLPFKDDFDDNSGIYSDSSAIKMYPPNSLPHAYNKDVVLRKDLQKEEPDFIFNNNKKDNDGSKHEKLMSTDANSDSKNRHKKLTASKESKDEKSTSKPGNNWFFDLFNFPINPILEQAEYWREKLSVKAMAPFRQTFNELELFAKSVFTEEKYIMEYSIEYGLLRLSPAVRQKLNIPVHFIILDANKDKCFGGPLSRFLLQEFVGYDQIIIGSLKKFAEKQNGRGFVRNVVSGEHYRFVNSWMSRTSYLAAGFIMIIFTLSVSMLLRYSHHQIFVFIVDLLRMLENNLQLSFPAAPLLTVVLALVGMEAIMSEFFNDTSTAFYTIVIIWLADQYEAVCCRTYISKYHWPKYFYLYHFAFYAYHYRFNGQFSGLALLCSWLFIQHSMCFFFHHYELPRLLQSMSVRNVVENMLAATSNNPGLLNNGPPNTMTNSSVLRTVPIANIPSTSSSGFVDNTISIVNNDGITQSISITGTRSPSISSSESNHSSENSDLPDSSSTHDDQKYEFDKITDDAKSDKNNYEIHTDTSCKSEKDDENKKKDDDDDDDDNGDGDKNCYNNIKNNSKIKNTNGNIHTNGANHSSNNSYNNCNKQDNKSSSSSQNNDLNINENGILKLQENNSNFDNGNYTFSAFYNINNPAFLVPIKVQNKKLRKRYVIKKVNHSVPNQSLGLKKKSGINESNDVKIISEIDEVDEYSDVNPYIMKGKKKTKPRLYIVRKPENNYLKKYNKLSKLTPYIYDCSDDFLIFITNQYLSICISSTMDSVKSSIIMVNVILGVTSNCYYSVFNEVFDECWKLAFAFNKKDFIVQCLKTKKDSLKKQTLQKQKESQVVNDRKMANTQIRTPNSDNTPYQHFSVKNRKGMIPKLKVSISPSVNLAHLNPSSKYKSNSKQKVIPKTSFQTKEYPYKLSDKSNSINPSSYITNNDKKTDLKNEISPNFSVISNPGKESKVLKSSVHVDDKNKVNYDNYDQKKDDNEKSIFETKESQTAISQETEIVLDPVLYPERMNSKQNSVDNKSISTVSDSSSSSNIELNKRRESLTFKQGHILDLNPMKRNIFVENAVRNIHEWLISKNLHQYRSCIVYRSIIEIIMNEFLLVMPKLLPQSKTQLDSNNIPEWILKKSNKEHIQNLTLTHDSTAAILHTLVDIDEQEFLTIPFFSGTPFNSIYCPYKFVGKLHRGLSKQTVIRAAIHTTYLPKISYTFRQENITNHYFNYLNLSDNNNINSKITQLTQIGITNFENNLYEKSLVHKNINEYIKNEVFFSKCQDATVSEITIDSDLFNQNQNSKVSPVEINSIIYSRNKLHSSYVVSRTLTQKIEVTSQIPVTEFYNYLQKLSDEYLRSINCQIKDLNKTNINSKTTNDNMEQKRFKSRLFPKKLI